MQTNGAAYTNNNTARQNKQNQTNPMKFINNSDNQDKTEDVFAIPAYTTDRLSRNRNNNENRLARQIENTDTRDWWGHTRSQRNKSSGINRNRW